MMTPTGLRPRSRRIGAPLFSSAAKTLPNDWRSSSAFTFFMRRDIQGVRLTVKRRSARPNVAESQVGDRAQRATRRARAALPLSCDQHESAAIESVRTPEHTVRIESRDRTFRLWRNQDISTLQQHPALRLRVWISTEALHRGRACLRALRRLCRHDVTG